MLVGAVLRGFWWKIVGGRTVEHRPATLKLTRWHRFLLPSAPAMRRQYRCGSARTSGAKWSARRVQEQARGNQLKLLTATRMFVCFRTSLVLHACPTVSQKLHR